MIRFQVFEETGVNQYKHVDAPNNSWQERQYLPQKDDYLLYDNKEGRVYKVIRREFAFYDTLYSNQEIGIIVERVYE